MDKALVKLWEEHMHGLNKFPYSQHGGRQGHSTLTAVTQMTQDAANFLNQKCEKIVHVLGLDFAQYFDKVQSKKLLHKIAELEVTDKILFQWCAKLLRRKVQVRVG